MHGMPPAPRPLVPSHVRLTHPPQGERVEANARFLSTAQWCDEAASTITLLGGLSLLHVARDAVHLKLVTAYPPGAAAAAAGDPGPCATADHELSVHLQPGSTTGAAAGWRLGVGGCCPVAASLAAGRSWGALPAIRLHTPPPPPAQLRCSERRGADAG